MTRTESFRITIPRSSVQGSIIWSYLFVARPSQRARFKSVQKMGQPLDGLNFGEKDTFMSQPEKIANNINSNA